jgi:hypothetical protein
MQEGAPGLAPEFPNSGHNYRKKDDQAKNRHEKPSHVTREFPFALCGFILGFHGCPPSLKVGCFNRGVACAPPRSHAGPIGADNYRC